MIKYTGSQDEIERLNKVLASIHSATDLKTARRRALEGRTPPSHFYPLFEHMSREHGLTLLDSEMMDIIEIAKTL